MEVGVHARLGDGGLPVLAVPLGHFNGGGDAPVAERQQGLVVGMTFGLDIEVDVVEVGHQAAQAPDLAFSHGRVLERQPLVRGAGLRNERIHTPDDPADLAPRAGMLQHPLPNLARQIPNRLQVLVGLGGEADHVVQLQVFNAAREDKLRPIENLVVGHGLVDHPPEAVRSSFGRDGHAALAARAEQAHDRLRQVVEPERRRTDRIPHLDQSRQNPLDVGVITQRDRDEPDAAGVPPRVGGQLEDPIGRKRSDGQVVVARPAEPTEVCAPADDLHEEAGAELGVWREDTRRRWIECVGGLDRGLPHGNARLHAGRHGKAAGCAVGSPLRRVEGRDVHACLSRQPPEEIGPVRRRSKGLLERWHEHLTLTGRDHIGKRSQRLGVHERDGASDHHEGMMSAPFRGIPRESGKTQEREDVDVVPLE